MAVMPSIRPAAVGVAALVAALAVGGWAGVGLGVAGVALLLAAAYSRRDGLLLFGPFARWELARTARRPWLYVWRFVAGAAAALGTGIIMNDYTHWWDQITGGKVYVDPSRLTDAAEKVFFVIAGTTAAVAGLFAIFNLPSVVAEEREANRLDHLLVTDLRNHEILLGKTAGRLAVLLGYALVPVPVLAILTLFGGVEPRFVLTAAVLIVGGLAGITGVAVACSAMARKTSTAVGLTVAVLIGLFILTAAPGPLARFLSANYSVAPPGLVVKGSDGIARLNPTTVSKRIDDATRAGTLDADLGPILRHFLAGQLFVLAAGWWVAAFLLRRPAKPPTALGGKAAGLSRRLFTAAPFRPPVSDAPVLWNELSSPGSWAGRQLSRQLRGRWWLPPATAVSAWLVASYLIEPRYFREIVRGTASASGFILFWVVVVPVAWRASRRWSASGNSTPSTPCC